MSKVVILRPEPGASATLARAKVAGIDALAIPLFDIAPLEWVAPNASGFDAAIFTSANAVRFGGAKLAAFKALPAYCVGAATASAARDLGWAVTASGENDAAGLIARIPDGLRLLHFTGRDHQAIAGVTQIAVYASAPIEPPPALDALGGGVAMVHSPRAGARLAALVGSRGGIAIAAISAAAAAACGSGWRAVETIAAPDDGALLALAAALCQKR